MSPYELFSEFRTRLLEPALANLPESAELLDRSARFLLAVSKLSSDPQNIYRDALAVRVFEHLDKPQTDALLGRYPVLTSLVWKGEEERS